MLDTFLTFIFFSAMSMYRMSALSSKFSILVVPSANAAKRSALFDRDLLPGRVILFESKYWIGGEFKFNH